MNLTLYLTCYKMYRWPKISLFTTHYALRITLDL